MRQEKNTYFKAVACAFLALIIGGCVSIPDSPSPRFYMLKPITAADAAKTFEVAPDTIVGIGPVKIPEYLNRPQIVTRDKNNMLTFAQFDRWGEQLDIGLGRLIREDLIVLLPDATLEIFPWGLDIPARYQVFIDVVQMECLLEKEMFLAVQWSIFDLNKKKMLFIKRSEFRQPIVPHNYSGLVKALSDACASLSAEIAGALESLGASPEMIDDTSAPKQKTP